MQSYGSFQSVSNLLRLIQLDYQLDDDLCARYLHPVGFPAHATMPMPMPMAMPMAVAASVKSGGEKVKKPRKEQVHVPGVSCCGTNRHGKLCCNSRAKNSEYCRWHMDQKENPVAPIVERDPDEDVQSFSVHTPQHSRRPSVSGPVDPTLEEAQVKFQELATNRCGVGHLVKKVSLEDGKYQGVSIALNEHFGSEDLFREQAAELGLFLKVIEEHLVPAGYIPEETDDCESVCCAHTPEYGTDAECEEEEEVSTEMTLEVFQSMAEACGLTDELDESATSDESYYPFGIYITSFEDNSENIKLLQKNIESRGFSSEIIEEEDDEDEKYLVISRN